MSGLVAVTLVWGGTPAVAAEVPVAAAAKAPKRPVVTTSAKSVVEGKVIRVRATIHAGKRARRATLQRARVDVWGKTHWDVVRSKKVKGKGKKRRVAFRTTVTDENRARYRVSVTYKKRKKPRISKVARVQVWRWIPLYRYRAYYTAGGTNQALEYSTMSINGQSYRGWLTFGSLTSWEDRFTPGRNCRSFRGVAGLQDTSDDGTTGSITLRGDDEDVWQSPELSPGMAVTFRVPLKPKPYRFSILAANTSAGELTALPAIGDPAFLCTGV